MECWSIILGIDGQFLSECLVGKVRNQWTILLEYAIGIQNMTRGILPNTSNDNRAQYESVVERGLEELGQFLGLQGII